MRKQNEDDGKQHSIGEDAMALLCEYARWLTVFPISVKHFLRPAKRPGTMLLLDKTSVARHDEERTQSACLFLSI